MKRVTFLIDGFNLYHSLLEKPRYGNYKWMDLAQLCRNFIIPEKETIEEIYYFTALAYWYPQKEKRHKIYIKALRTKNILPIYGTFKMVDIKCRICHKWFKKPEEKTTDVNIAVHLFKLAIQKKCDTTIVVSGDTDLLPAIETFQLLYPTKRIGVVFPIMRATKELKNVADFSRRINEKHMKSSLFPKSIKLENGQEIDCPPEWSYPNK